MSSVSASSFFRQRNVTCAAVAGGTGKYICEGYFTASHFLTAAADIHELACLRLQVNWFHLCFILVKGWFAFKMIEINLKIPFLQIIAVLSKPWIK